MAEIITQAKVDELLESVQEGFLELEPAPSPASGEFVRYDFSKPHTLSRVFEGNLATVSDSFAKQIALTLSKYFRSSVAVTHKDLKHVLFQEYISKVSKPSCIAIVNLPPLRGQAILNIDSSLIFALVDKLMGGGGRPIDEPREFTEIEFGVSEKVVEKILYDFKMVSSRFADITPSLSRVENNPEFVNICAGMERVISLVFEVNMPTVNSLMNISIPISAFEPVSDSFDPVEEVPERSAEDKVEDANRLYRTLQGVRLLVCAQIGETELPFERAKLLKEGDVVVLDRRASEPVDILIEGVPKFLGIPGRITGKKAVKVVSVVKGDESG